MPKMCFSTQQNTVLDSNAYLWTDGHKLALTVGGEERGQGGRQLTG
jgi:hypothetical protein